MTRREFDRASEGVVAPEQAEAIWGALVRGAPRSRFDLPNVAYYFGALVVISAMGWFMTEAWERFGGAGILAISLAYAGAFVAAGRSLWRRGGLRTPGCS